MPKSYHMRGINSHNKKTKSKFHFSVSTLSSLRNFPEPPTLVFGGDVFLGGVLIDDFGFTSDPLEPPGVL